MQTQVLFTIHRRHTGIYICGKVFKWLKKMGGLEVMKERNEKKAKLLYDYLDQSKLFKGTVEKKRPFSYECTL